MKNLPLSKTVVVALLLWALIAYDKKKMGWVWVLGLTALVYNPVFRAHFPRGLWVVINLVTIGIAVASAKALNSKSE